MDLYLLLLLLIVQVSLIGACRFNSTKLYSVYCSKDDKIVNLLAHLEDVQVLTINGTRERPPIYFKNLLRFLPNVISLTIVRTDFNIIDTRLFDYTFKLQHLNLANNKINIINPSAWLNATSLTVLNLTGNRLETLEPKAFDNLPGLKILDLSGNLIKSLKPETFEGLPQLTVLNLSGNPIVSHPERLSFLKNRSDLQLDLGIVVANENSTKPTEAIARSTNGFQIIVIVPPLIITLLFLSVIVGYFVCPTKLSNAPIDRIDSEETVYMQAN